MMQGRDEEKKSLWKRFKEWLGTGRPPTPELPSFETSLNEIGFIKHNQEKEERSDRHPISNHGIEVNSIDDGRKYMGTWEWEGPAIERPSVKPPEIKHKGDDNMDKGVEKIITGQEIYNNIFKLAVEMEKLEEAQDEVNDLYDNPAEKLIADRIREVAKELQGMKDRRYVEWTSK